ncbi:MAG: hypothetical protein K2Y05_04195 [Hyphomicrobiaceae bacterium]|nr:hypothetical protein [Hyphomicrobiaceae bacterium]
MLNWIRHIRAFIATLAMVAFLPWAVFGGQALVWCVGADGHSAIEQVHDAGELAEAANVATHETTVGRAAPDCNDFEIASVTTGRHSPLVVWGAADVEQRTWFASTHRQRLQLQAVVEVKRPQIWVYRADTLALYLAHQRTVILRV